MINIQLIKAILDNTFCEIDIARDGEEALKMLTEATKEGENLYQLLYLDQYMPKLRGEKVMSAYRAIEKKKNLRAIFSVSISGEIEKMKQDNTLFDIYLGKPFNMKKIKETFQEAFKKTDLPEIDYMI